MSSFTQNTTVYGETQMIEIQRNYKITLTEEQARQLYHLLHSTEEGFSYGEQYCELGFLSDELKKIFDIGVR